MQVPLKASSRSPACDSSPCRPCHPCRFSACPSCTGAWRSSRPSWRCVNISPSRLPPGRSVGNAARLNLLRIRDGSTCSHRDVPLSGACARGRQADRASGAACRSSAIPPSRTARSEIACRQPYGRGAWATPRRWFVDARTGRRSPRFPSGHAPDRRTWCGGSPAACPRYGGAMAGRNPHATFGRTGRSFWGQPGGNHE